MGSHPVLCPRESLERPAIGGSMFAFAPPEIVARLQKAGIEVVTDDTPRRQIPLADPLVVQPCFDPEDEDGRPYRLELAPDDLHKANISGGDPYYCEVPDPAADVTFHDSEKHLFVQYLRRAFRWGGFPGWEHDPRCPEREIAHLAEGLLAI